MSRKSDKIDNIFVSTWSSLVIRFRWLIIILIPVLVGLLSAPAGNIYFAHSPDMWFLDDDPVNKSYQELKNKFGDTQYLLVGFSSADGGTVLDPDVLQAVTDTHNFLLDNNQVANVHSLANFQHISSANDTLQINDLLDQDAEEYSLLSSEAERSNVEKILMDQPIILDDLVTRDLRHTAILAETFYQSDGRVDHHVALVDSVKEFLDVQLFSEKNINVYLFGRPYISHQLTSGNVKDQIIMYPLLFLATILLLAFVFRKIRPTILPWVVIVLGVLIAYTVQGLAGWPTTVANASMPFLVIILGVGMSVHVMVDHYRQLAAGYDGLESAKRSINHLFKPTFFTTVTTLFGFVGLSVTELEPLRQYSVLAITGVVACFLLSMTLLPALMSFAKKPPRWATQELISNGRKKTPSGIAEIIVRMSVARPKLWVLVGSALFAMSVLMTSLLKMDTNFVNIFKQDSEFRVAFEYFDKEFQGGQAIEFVVDSGSEGSAFEPEFLLVADELESWVNDLPEMGKPVSVLNYIKQMNRSLNNDNQEFWSLPETREQTVQLLLLYENSGPERGIQDLVSVDGRYLRITARASNMSAVETQILTEKIQSHIEQAWPNLSVELTGDLILYNKLENHIAEGMLVSFSVALGTIAICLFGLFRRFGLTLLALIPSVFPIFIGGAVMKIFGIYPDINSLIIASITIGIAVDDTIHYLFRYEQARALGAPPKQAAEIASVGAGKAILLSTIVLSIGFSVFLFSSLMSGVFFGVLSMVVIVFALIGDLLFLPAMLLMTDKRALPKKVQSNLVSTNTRFTSSGV